MTFTRTARQIAGFTTLDVLLAVGIGVTLTAMAVAPAARALTFINLDGATRDLERELQTARLKAVSANRRLQVRFNCPAAGQFRMVEITGDAMVDTASNRCSQSIYPYPTPKDNDPATPEFDGPVRHLPGGVAVTATDLIFTSNGTVFRMVSGVQQPVTGTVSFTITKGGSTRTVTVNALGKIQLQ